MTETCILIGAPVEAGTGRRGAEMGAAAEAMEYERAAALRDRIKALTAVQSVQAINPRGEPVSKRDELASEPFR